jgi:GMC oxidoreductase
MRPSVFLASFIASVSLAQSYGNSSCDYVIVGGKSAGFALANRLSANFSVVVIEAGGFYQAVDNGTVQVRGLDILGAGMSPDDVVDTDWKFVTEPQAGANGGKLHYARGKGLGGRFTHYSTFSGFPACADGSSMKFCTELHNASDRNIQLGRSVSGGR